MDVITRNLFRLLRAGAFEEEQQIEPLSVWKWGKLYKAAMHHGIDALVYDGILRCSDQFFVQIPAEQLEQWKAATADIEQSNRRQNIALSNLFPQLVNEQTRPILLKGAALGTLYSEPLHRKANRINLFFPYETKARKADQWVKEHATETLEQVKNGVGYKWLDATVENRHRVLTLANTLYNRTLQNIIDEEFCAIPPTYAYINGTKVETLPHTLALLTIIVGMAQEMMSNGFHARQLTDLGIFLRKAGDKVDYVKLQTWIERLHLTLFAQVEGTLLMELLDFEEDEIPFMEEATDVAPILQQEVFNKTGRQWHLRRSARYFHYYPGESVASLLTSFAHTLSQIEE